MAETRFLTYVLLAVLTTLAIFGQSKSSSARADSAPQISGTFLDTDGARRLTLAYRPTAKPEIFDGVIHSTCKLPAGKSGKPQPLSLAAIPVGTHMTVFYVSRGKAGQPAKASDNVILAVRFDRLRLGSTFPVGVSIPCFKAAGHQHK